MNAVELASFKTFILDFQISQFDNSSNCVAVLTKDKIIIGFISEGRESRWTLYGSVDTEGASAVAVSPSSHTVLQPPAVKLAYCDSRGVHSLLVSPEHSGTLGTLTLLKEELEVCSMSYNEEGDKLAMTGADRVCRILSYQSDSLSESDSMECDAVGEGCYEQSRVSLSSEGLSVSWHKRRSNCLVVAEVGGVLRLLACVPASTEDSRETFVCEYVINIGLRLQTPLYGMDSIASDSSPHDFIVACPGGLFVFSLERPLSSLEKVRAGGSCGAGGNTSVKVSQSWGHGSLLATVFLGGQLAVTEVGGSGKVVLNCPMEDCVAIAWHKTRPMLLASSASSLLAIEFSG